MIKISKKIIQSLVFTYFFSVCFVYCYRRKKMFKYKIVFILIFLIVGCRTMNNPQEDKITLPRKISIDIPQILKGEENTQKKQLNQNGDIGLGWIQNNVVTVEDIIVNQEIFLVLMRQVMPQIQDRCQSKKCIIESNQIFLTLDNNLLREIERFNPNIDVHQRGTIPFGEIEFTKYDSEYLLKADNTEIRSEIDKKSINKQINSIRWSRDERSVISSYSYDDEKSNSSLELNYSEGNSGQNDMNITETFERKDGSKKYSFDFFLGEKGDINETVAISFTIKGEVKQESMLSISTGEVSLNGGYIYSSGHDGDIFYREKSTFDRDGVLVESIYCYADMECSMDDESTWFVDELVEVFDLKVTGGSLEDGEYYLSKERDINKIDIDNIDEIIVGVITIFNNTQEGYIYESYVDRLNELEMIYIQESDDSIQIVPIGDRPNLII